MIGDDHNVLDDISDTDSTRSIDQGTQTDAQISDEDCVRVYYGTKIPQDDSDHFTSESEINDLKLYKHCEKVEDPTGSTTVLKDNILEPDDPGSSSDSKYCNNVKPYLKKGIGCSELRDKLINDTIDTEYPDYQPCDSKTSIFSDFQSPMSKNDGGKLRFLHSSKQIRADDVVELKNPNQDLKLHTLANELNGIQFVEQIDRDIFKEKEERVVGMNDLDENVAVQITSPNKNKTIDNPISLEPSTADTEKSAEKDIEKVPKNINIVQNTNNASSIPATLVLDQANLVSETKPQALVNNAENFKVSLCKNDLGLQDDLSNISALPNFNITETLISVEPVRLGDKPSYVEEKYNICKTCDWTKNDGCQPPPCKEDTCKIVIESPCPPEKTCKKKANCPPEDTKLEIQLPCSIDQLCKQSCTSRTPCTIEVLLPTKDGASGKNPKKLDITLPCPVYNPCDPFPEEKPCKIEVLIKPCPPPKDECAQKECKKDVDLTPKDPIKGKYYEEPIRQKIEEQDRLNAPGPTTTEKIKDFCGSVYIRGKDIATAISREICCKIKGSRGNTTEVDVEQKDECSSTESSISLERFNDTYERAVCKLKCAIEDVYFSLFTKNCAVETVANENEIQSEDEEPEPETPKLSSKGVAIRVCDTMTSAVNIMKKTVSSDADKTHDATNENESQSETEEQGLEPGNPKLSAKTVAMRVCDTMTSAVNIMKKTVSSDADNTHDATNESQSQSETEEQGSEPETPKLSAKTVAMRVCDTMTSAVNVVKKTVSSDADNTHDATNENEGKSEIEEQGPEPETPKLSAKTVAMRVCDTMNSAVNIMKKTVSSDADNTHDATNENESQSEIDEQGPEPETPKLSAKTVAIKVCDTMTSAVNILKNTVSSGGDNPYHDANENESQSEDEEPKPEKPKLSAKAVAIKLCDTMTSAVNIMKNTVSSGADNPYDDTRDPAERPKGVSNIISETVSVAAGNVISSIKTKFFGMFQDKICDSASSIEEETQKSVNFQETALVINDDSDDFSESFTGFTDV